MSFVIVAPEVVAAAASDLEGIGAALGEANAAAAAALTQVVAAAADEVSAAIAALFSGHGQEYLTLSAQAAAFHDRFARALSAGAGWYASAEAANASALQLLQSAQRDVLNAVDGALFGDAPTGGAGQAGGAGGSSGVQAMMTSALAPGGRTALIVGSTGTSHPSWGYIWQVYDLYIAPHFSGYTPSGLYTPAQFQPWTGIPSLTYDQSTVQGAGYLHTAIMQKVAAGGDVVVLGFSQGSTVATLEMRYLETLPAAARPSPEQLAFVLLGNPNNPNGGILARFPGLYLQSIGLTFNGATPVTEYPTTIYTTQYDGFADFPQYPLNIPADLNALLGIYYSHGLYQELTPDQVASGVVLPVSSPDINSTYILIPNEDLPLLRPFRGIVPEPVLDLVEPDLRVIIELGYDRTGYADLPTPAALLPTHINPITVAGDLAQGTVLGIDNALADVGLPPLPDAPSLPSLPLVSQPSNIPLTMPSLPPIVPDRIPVPPQLGGVIGGPLNALDGLLDTVINDNIDPVITSTIYQAGEALSAAASSHGAPAELTNAIFIGEQVLPILVEGPGVFVTADTHYLVNAVDDVVAGDLSGFNQNLQLIPATNAMLLVFAFGIPAVAAAAILTGQGFPV
ncbi:PE family protein [Mycobacterium lacus]|uniref:PE family protein n=1 Tax=Mycobacterium lacus TaxID=169765 RepID=A0A1X1YG24_9MYCO|nr:PE-PPE domain-containing protein [Mycobacterium lacus]MCV7125001.1 PE-PPE domain-containing protein [Mycobacterium lacus]ORW10046.1 PE family protein [Mycobacterium lacus]BBX96002.1 PE family protein [Mycobacterium lacus]